MTPSIRIEQHERLAIVETDRSRALEIELSDPNTLRNAITRFAGRLEPCRPTGFPVPSDAANEFVIAGRHMAIDCFNESSDGDYSQLADVVEAIHQQLMHSKVLGYTPGTEIVAVGSAAYLPWEWLGIHDDDYERAEALSSMVGTASVCWRRPALRQSQSGNRYPWSDRVSSYLKSMPLQLRLFRHAGIPGTRAEVAFFKRRKREFDLIGPIPEDDELGELALAEHLADPRRVYNGRTLDGGDQVVHIACDHQLADSQDSIDVLSLPFVDSVMKFGDEEHHWVRVRDLDNQLASLSVQRARLPRDPGPLVFFNACRGHYHPYSATSVVRIMMRNLSRGVISTIVNVPDRVASLLSKLFYERLLNGDTVPEALRQAGISLFEQTGSPLGALYTYTGDPDLCLSAPLQRVVDGLPT